MKRAWTSYGLVYLSKQVCNYEDCESVDGCLAEGDARVLK